MANQLSRFAASKSSTTTSPLPKVAVPAMPDKLRRIDPDGCAAWEGAVADAIHENFRLLEEKLNVVIDAQKTGG